MAEAVLTNPVVMPEAAAVKIQRNESYFQLVSRRFRRSKPAIVGGAFVLMLGFLAIFAEFFAPYPLDKYNSKNSSTFRNKSADISTTPIFVLILNSAIHLCISLGCSLAISSSIGSRLRIFNWLNCWMR